MKIPAKFKEYIWLVNTIRKARRITFAEINEKWLQTDMSEGIELARSTFARHKDAIEDIFGIYIDCDRQNGYEYYIGNDYVLREDSVQNWMLSTLSVSNVISESMSLQDRILLQEVPYEGEYLKMVIDAMKKSVRIESPLYSRTHFANCLIIFMSFRVPLSSLRSQNKRNAPACQEQPTARGAKSYPIRGISAPGHAYP